MCVLLSASNLSVRLGDRLVLSDVSFIINPADRWGLIGPNGAGKSTLLGVLAGEIIPSSGSVQRSPGVHVRTLRQGFVERPDCRLAEALDAPTGGLLSARDRLNDALVSLETEQLSDAILARYDNALADFEQLGGYTATDRLEVLLARLGLNGVPLDTLLSALSGGEKTRAGLAALLATEPDVLLLDEPTSHLDRDALDWLEAFVMSYRGAVVVVSHDRQFLDQTVAGILSIDPLTGHVSVHYGSYRKYEEQKRTASEAARQAYQQQQSEIARVERDIRAVANNAQKTENATQHDFLRARAKKVARTAKVRERKLQRTLEAGDLVEKPVLGWNLAIDFGETPESSREVVTLDHVSFSYGARLVLRDVSLSIRNGERVALTGANGSGKSTLIRLLTGDLEPDTGSLQTGPSVVMGHYDQEQHNVSLDRSVLDQIRHAATNSETDARRFLHRFLFGGDTVYQLAGSLSYGERARLSLALLVLKGANFLILDEPLNHLDLPSREQFEATLSTFDGTILTVLHDRYAIEQLATRVVALADGRLTEH